jgi:outer membrane protein assembly factor BamB
MKPQSILTNPNGRGRRMTQSSALKIVLILFLFISIFCVIGTASSTERTHQIEATTNDSSWIFDEISGTRSTPAILNDTAYITTYGEDVTNLESGLGSGSSLDLPPGNLYSIKRQGTDWSFTANSSIRGSPIHTNGSIVFADLTGEIYSVAATDGKLEWQTSVPGYVFSSVTQSKRSLIFSSSTNLNIYSRNTTGYVGSITKSDGSTSWIMNISSGVLGEPAVSNGMVYFGDMNGSFYSVNATSGDTNWEFKQKQQVNDTIPIFSNNAVVSSPVVNSGIAYFGTATGKVYALDSRTGEQLWMSKTTPFADALGVNRSELPPSLNFSSPILSTPKVDNDSIYLGTWHGITSMDTRTGESEWTTDVPGRITTSSPTINGKYIYIGTIDGVLYSLKKDTGEIAWRYQTGGQISSTPVVTDGRVYITNSSALISLPTPSNDGNIWTEWNGSQTEETDGTAVPYEIPSGDEEDNTDRNTTVEDANTDTPGNDTSDNNTQQDGVNSSIQEDTGTERRGFFLTVLPLFVGVFLFFIMAGVYLIRKDD